MIRKKPTPEVINLVDNSFSNIESDVVDLTEADSEVSVLSEIINVDELSRSVKKNFSKTQESRINIKNNDVHIVNVSDSRNSSESIDRSLSCLSLGGTSRTTRNSQNSFFENFFSSKSPNTRSTVKSESVTVTIKENQAKRKVCYNTPVKRGKQEPANIPSVSTRSNSKVRRKRSRKISTTNKKPKSTTSNEKQKGFLQVYYEQLERAVGKNKKSQRKNSPKAQTLKINHQNTKYNSSASNLKVNKISKKKAKKRKALQRISNNNVTPPKPFTRRRVCENNLFNPNPYVVDEDGLRPIAIDGSNIAVGHGRGRFSPKGIQICVDFFSKKGHKNIKVFLPLYRQNQIETSLLEDLNTKCDVIFTPSRTVNGRTITSYDDRFIIQFAVEVGGVVVSNDNYRDLLKENPLWRKTICERLLMFSWADDVLMFPVDPNGRSGPTLEELLRF